MSASAKSIVSSHAKPAELVRRREPVQIILRPTAQTGKGELLVLGVYADGTLPRAAQSFDAVLGGRLEELAKQAELPSKVGETLLLYYASGETTRRVLLLSLGPSQRVRRQGVSEGARSGSTRAGVELDSKHRSAVAGCRGHAALGRLVCPTSESRARGRLLQVRRAVARDQGKSQEQHRDSAVVVADRGRCHAGARVRGAQRSCDCRRHGAHQGSGQSAGQCL